MDTPLKHTLYDWMIEGLTLLILIFALYPLLFYGQLGEGDIIPIHYNLAGNVDGWGDRSFLWILPLIAFVVYVSLSLIERAYKIFNLPFKVAPGNLTLLYRLEIRLIRHLKLYCVLIFSYINNSSYALAAGEGTGLNKYIMMLLLGGLFATNIVYYVKIYKLKE